MATFAEVRNSLDALETTRKRAEQIIEQVAALKDQIARLQADLNQIRPAVIESERAFKTLASRLDITAE